MTSEAIRDPVKDHLLTPQNSVFIIIETGGTMGVQLSYNRD